MEDENVEWRMWSAWEMEDPERGDAQRSGVHMWRCSVEVVLGRGEMNGGGMLSARTERDVRSNLH